MKESREIKNAYPRSTLTGIYILMHNKYDAYEIYIISVTIYTDICIRCAILDCDVASEITSLLLTMSVIEYNQNNLHNAKPVTSHHGTHMYGHVLDRMIL